uniref:FLYWCH-type domain-containing protein n=1 Tax=Anopheles melas TaxID=34690 RepID=A0A182TM22_9DIPT
TKQSSDQKRKDDYRNHPDAFELPAPVKPGVSAIRSYRPVQKLNNTDGKQRTKRTATAMGVVAKASTAKTGGSPPGRLRKLSINEILATPGTPVVYLTNRFGSAKVVLDEHQYVYHFAAKGVSYYRCDQFKRNQYVPHPDTRLISKSRISNQLYIDGFPFTRHMMKKDTIYWRCIQFRAFRCPARHRQNRATGLLKLVHSEHNHEQIQTRHPAVKNVSFIRSKRGAMQLHVNGYFYTKDKTRNNITFWSCTQARVYCYNQSAEKRIHKAELNDRNERRWEWEDEGISGFSKASSNGMANIIYWRCTEYRKQKCRSTLKTMGKQLYIIDAKHNHVPKKYGHIMSATLPIFNVVKPNVDTVKMINNVRPNPDHIVKQLSNGHTLMKLVKTRVRGFCQNANDSFN